ncbi:MAG: dihydrolipoyllysine-residue acetyltransferase [Deltaproteobacteria bacterium]|nr:MAG: dihydrolipoyllysine-residue acetyltransferase [Deltaproteobacteria bacterium]
MGVQQKVLLPDIGDFTDVDVAEVLVAKGQKVEAEQSLIVLESDKASMEIPSPFAGTVVEMKVSVGDRVSEGALIAILEVDEAAAQEAPVPAAPEPAEPAEPARAPEAKPAPAPEPSAARAEAPRQVDPALLVPREQPAPAVADEIQSAQPLPHASPSVRRVAREMGVDLRLVPGTGPKARITPDDVRRYVKSMIEKGTAAGVPIAGVSVAAPPQIDFAKFGPTEIQPLHRIRKLSAANLHRSWVTIPHVTQHDEADISDLDEFRKQMKPEAEARRVKLTFLPFVIKACSYALKEHPQFNASLDHTGENLILKRYYHVGVAVDTENGLVVPVVRDADRKGLYEIAAELMDISARARGRKLSPGDLQGASFSISSLGGIGGTFFTPIVNHPEVAILGVGKMDWRPVYSGGSFVPRLILPLSLSYDHRVIDGADAARFTTRLAALLSDLRRLIL